MKHLFIVNPIAGGKDHTDEVRAKVEEAFKNRDAQFEVYVTKAPMDATDKIRHEAESGEHIHVYACGGDGTFNECACGAAKLPNVAVCPLPVGTGNDFCRMFGEEQNLFRDIDALIEGSEAPIDLIDCNGRYSANICSVGIDARIGTSVHKYSGLPLIGGAGGYVVSAIVNMFKGISQHMRVISDDFEADGKHSLICVCNGRFYGGGFNPCTYAMPNDGILDILVVKQVSLPTFAALIKKYSNGRADEFIKYVTHLRTDNIEIDFDEESVVNLDGEAIFTKKAVIKLVPEAMNLIVPRGMRFFEESRLSESCKT